MDELSSQLSGLSVSSPALSENGPHKSLAAMLALGNLERLKVCGDGNCAYYAAAAAAGPELLEAAGFWALGHAGSSSTPTDSDLRLQHELRQRVVDWLQQPENAQHRYAGTSEAEPVFDPATGKYEGESPPPASAMERHRATGTYAQTPQLRALAELLGRPIVSLDTAQLFDRVPVHSPGGPTARLRSWRRQLAQTLAEGATSPPPPLVVMNNGRLDAGGHYDATRRRAAPT